MSVLKSVRPLISHFLIMLANLPVYAANIEVISSGIGDVPVISIDGTLDFGDENKFINIAISYQKAIVVLSSGGGNLNAGIEIGKAIRMKGFSTYILEGDVCASACALAWLGGRIRAMSSESRIGFHAASNKATGEITPEGNALVGAYLNQLGLPLSAIIFITEAHPTDIRWLTPTNALKNGIDLKVLNPSKGQSDNSEPNANAKLPVEKDTASPTNGSPTQPLIAKAFPVVLKGVLLKPFCHMDMCTWMSLEDREIVSQNIRGELFKLRVKWWSSRHPNGSYNIATRRTGGNESERYVFCSKVSPSVAFSVDEKWVVNTLAPDKESGVFGVNANSYTLYFAACHGLNLDGYKAYVYGQTLGYKVDVNWVKQVSVASPEALINLPH